MTAAVNTENLGLRLGSMHMLLEEAVKLDPRTNDDGESSLVQMFAASVQRAREIANDAHTSLVGAVDGTSQDSPLHEALERSQVANHELSMIEEAVNDGNEDSFANRLVKTLGNMQAVLGELALLRIEAMGTVLQHVNPAYLPCKMCRRA